MSHARHIARIAMQWTFLFRLPFATTHLMKVVDLKVNNVPIFNKQLDLSTTSQVCGLYNVVRQGLSISCNVCITVEDDPSNPSQQCVVAQPTVLKFSL